MMTYVFPGQGSQKIGMGEGLFDEFADWTAKADQLLGYSVKELCLQDPERRLADTRFTQPALYVVNALSYQKKLAIDGEPDFVAGHSLGEYNALLAAGVFDFVSGLRLVQQRGELMSRARGGGMAAVIGLSLEQVRNVLQDSGLESIDIANLNTPTQFVISGKKDDIGKAQMPFESAGARVFVPLQVGGAFHSRYMEESRGAFESFLEGFELNEPAIPVVSNVRAAPYGGRRTKELLAEQITSPVRWTESVQYLKARGSSEFFEVGPGQVLTNLIGQIALD